MTTIGFGKLPPYNFYPKRPVVKEENNNKTENNAGNTDKAPQPNVAKTFDLNQLGLYNTISLKPIAVVGTEKAEEHKAQKSDKPYTHEETKNKKGNKVFVEVYQGKIRVIRLKVTTDNDGNRIIKTPTSEQIRDYLEDNGYTFPNNKSK